MIQIVYRGVDLVQAVAVRNQVVKLQLAFTVPANKDRKVALRPAIAAAGAGKRTVANE